MRFPMVLMCAAACGGGGSSSDGTTVPAVDPMMLAGEVQETELAATIQALEQMGTRYTLSDGDERARDYLVLPVVPFRARRGGSGLGVLEECAPEIAAIAKGAAPHELGSVPIAFERIAPALSPEPPARELGPAEVLAAVPSSQREAALALGATRWEAVWSAVLPYARPGLVGAVVLGLGRALGETMAVVMVIGNRHELSASLVEPGYTMAAVIANEFNEAAGLQRAALFEIGLVLFAVTLAVNAFARLLVWRVARDSAVGSTAL